MYSMYFPREVLCHDPLFKKRPWCWLKGHMVYHKIHINTWEERYQNKIVNKKTWMVPRGLSLWNHAVWNHMLVGEKIFYGTSKTTFLQYLQSTKVVKRPLAPSDSSKTFLNFRGHAWYKNGCLKFWYKNGCLRFEPCPWSSKTSLRHQVSSTSYKSKVENVGCWCIFSERHLFSPK